MADDDASEKTQDPTQKRLDDAHERGDVVKSQEVNSWFVIAGAALVDVVVLRRRRERLGASLRNLIEKAYMIRVDGPGLLALVKSSN